MSHLGNIFKPCVLVALAFFLAAPSQAGNQLANFELTPTGAMADVSGMVSLYPARNGSQHVAILVSSPLVRNGGTVRLTVVRKDGQELDLALLTVELGSAFFKCDEFKDGPSPVFPTTEVAGLFVYYQDRPILAAKFPG